ncbi:flagellar biosynthesis protein FlgM [Bacteroidia bacterium]|nr:flagellar biosynthesis protein FlgM [Bacteroidia bacterium]
MEEYNIETHAFKEYGFSFLMNFLRNTLFFIWNEYQLTKYDTIMQWQGKRESTNVEDNRRASGGGMGGFGGGFGGFGGLGGNKTSGRGCGCGSGIGLIILVIILWIMGINPLTLLDMGGGSLPLQQQTYNSGITSAEEDSLVQFASVILANTEEVWTQIFSQMGRTYRKPTLSIYSGQMRTACGMANSDVGPFYCSADEKIYLDVSFFSQMATQLHAGGDFAYAYVIAHEVGHHVQKLLGTLEQVDAQMARSTQTVANELSVRLELQADFYAGVWAHYTEKYNWLDPGDIEEALNAASQIGDDTLQKQAQGYVQPDSFTHGTSAQRYNWFYKGYKTGNMNDGNTFSVNPL